MTSVADIQSWLLRLAPLHLAAKWDNVGLLLGDAHQSVASAITCLTITPEVVAEAVTSQTQLIVSHHPILFKPTQRLTAATSDGKMVLDLARAGVAVYSAHTAYDNCDGGVNEQLAALIGLGNVTALRQGKVERRKLVTFVPHENRDHLLVALFEAGAGRIGVYRECSFRTDGTGTFYGDESANPAIGERGRREEVAESRVEVVLPASAENSVIRALRQAHPYEEPAFDIYSIQPEVVGGEGRIGELSSPLTLASLAEKLRVRFGLPHIEAVGDGRKSIRTIALACGAAGELLGDAIAQSADLFLTGEMRFHDLLRAKSSGVGVILPGHYATERFAMEELARQLSAAFPEVEVMASKAESDPLTRF